MDDGNSGQSLTCVLLVLRYDRLESLIRLLSDVIGTGASYKPRRLHQYFDWASLRDEASHDGYYLLF